MPAALVELRQERVLEAAPVVDVGVHVWTIPIAA